MSGLRVVAMHPLCVRACSAVGVRCAPAESGVMRAMFAGACVVLYVGMRVHVRVCVPRWPDVTVGCTLVVCEPPMDVSDTIHVFIRKRT